MATPSGRSSQGSGSLSCSAARCDWDAVKLRSVGEEPFDVVESACDAGCDGSGGVGGGGIDEDGGGAGGVGLGRFFASSLEKRSDGRREGPATACCVLAVTLTS